MISFRLSLFLTLFCFGVQGAIAQCLPGLGDCDIAKENLTSSAYPAPLWGKKAILAGDAEVTAIGATPTLDYPANIFPIEAVGMLDLPESWGVGWKAEARDGAAGLAYTVPASVAQIAATSGASPEGIARGLQEEFNESMPGQTTGQSACWSRGDILFCGLEKLFDYRSIGRGTRLEQHIRVFERAPAGSPSNWGYRSELVLWSPGNDSSFFRPIFRRIVSTLAVPVADNADQIPPTTLTDFSESRKFQNPRYDGLSVTYPPNVLRFEAQVPVRQETSRFDTPVLLGPGIAVTVSGDVNGVVDEFKNVSEWLSSQLSVLSGVTITYTAKGNSWAVVSGYTGSQIFYIRAISSCRYLATSCSSPELFSKVEFVYLRSHKNVYRRLIEWMAPTLTPASDF